MSAADYVSRSGNIDLFVIEASEVARARSSTRKIQEVADRLTALHKRTSGELSLAGRRLNLLPSATLDPVHQAMLERLRTAPDFDRAYADAMKSVHSYAYAMNTSYAARGSSPTLRAVAAAMVPEMQSALRLLTYI
jgi:putative membrane protein